MKIPLTAKHVENHFRYRWWQYILLVGALVLGLNLFFTVTEAKPAEDRKLECIVYGVGNRDVLSAWLEQCRQDEFEESTEALAKSGLPPQDAFECSFITPDESGMQAIAIRVMFAGEGDLLIVPKEEFQNYAETGILMPLNTIGEVTRACAEYGVGTEKGRWKGPDGETRLYGIPVASLPRLNAILYGSAGESYLCIRTNNGNETAAEQLMCCFLRDMHDDPQEAE